jgi:hypothetical protein
MVVSYLLAAGLIGFACQGGGGEEGKAPTPTPTSTPIRQAGQSGTRPPAATPVIRRATDTMGKFEPTATPCDNVRQVQVELSKLGVNCSTYNFTSLNDEAQKLADAQLNKVQCPPGAPCSIRHAFYSFWAATCAGSTATVKIKGYAVCATNTSNPNSTDPGIPPPADKAHPSNRATPAPVTIKAGENDIFQPIDNGDYAKGEIGGHSTASAGTTLACPSNSLYVFTYREKDPLIPAVGLNDYGPVIQRAVIQAIYFYNQYSCAPACVKFPFAPLYTKWSVDGEYAVVEVYFMVTCR